MFEPIASKDVRGIRLSIEIIQKSKHVKSEHVDEIDSVKVEHVDSERRNVKVNLEGPDGREHWRGSLLNALHGDTYYFVLTINEPKTLRVFV